MQKTFSALDGANLYGTTKVFGKIGIDTTPQTMFHSEKFANGDSLWYEIWKHSFNSGWEFSLCNRHRPGADSSFMFRHKANGAIHDVMTFFYQRVGINRTLPDYTLDVNGSLRCSSFVNSSDDRIKYNEEDVSNCLMLINKLKPQKYQRLTPPAEQLGVWIPTDDEWETVKDNFEI